jgi:hypothetical protein
MYLASPFPKATGFSPYRFPGLIVHLPVMLLFLLVGARLTFWNPILYPLFLVHLMAGVYMGRDIAIFGHYNPLIPLGVVAALLWCILSQNSVLAILPRGDWTASLLGTVAVAVVFLVWVRWRIREE